MRCRASDGGGRWERIAGALLADEVAWLPDDYTLAEAIGRLDDAWLSALLDAGLGHIRQPVSRDGDAARENLVTRVTRVAGAMLAADGDGGGHGAPRRRTILRHPVTTATRPRYRQRD